MKKIFMGMMVLAAFMLVGTQMAEAKGNRGNRAQVSENTETTDSTVVGKKHPNARQNRGEEATSSKRLEGKEKAIQRRLEGKEKAIQRRLEGKEKAMQRHNGEGKKMGHRKHKRANTAEDETTDNQTKQRKNRRMNKQSD